MHQLLSSRLTLLYRYVWPAMCLAGLVIAALAFARSSEGPPLGILLLPSLVLAAHYFFYLRRLLRVVATDDGLLVSNYRREIRVPWSDVVRMGGNRWSQQSLITLDLRSPTPLGRKISFLPYQQAMLPLWRKHPAARLIEDRAGLGTTKR